MIKRYFLSGDVNGLDIEEDPTGEWVKWDDMKIIIQEVFEAADDHYMDKRCRIPSIVRAYGDYLTKGYF